MNRKPRILALLLILSMLTTLFGTMSVSAAAPTSLDVAAIAGISDDVLAAFNASIAEGNLDIDGVAYGVTYPATLDCGTYSLTSEEYILMAASALYALMEGKADTTVIDYKAVTVKEGAVKNGTGTTLNKAQYLELAERVSKYGTTTGTLPVSFNRPTDGTNVYEGRMTVYSIGHLFASVLASYTVSGTLPETATFKPVHMGDVEVTPAAPSEPDDWYAAVLEAAAFVTEQMAANILPASIPVGPLTVTPAQFQYLACKVVVGLNAGTTTEELTYPLLSEPANPQGTATGKIYLADYVAMAEKIIAWGDANTAAPNYSTSSNIGITNYYDVVHMYAKVLNFYKTNTALPNYNTVIGWSGTVEEVELTTTTAATTTATTTSATASTTTATDLGSDYANVLAAATYVVEYVESKEAFPSTINIGTTSCTPAQYLYVATSVLVNISNGVVDGSISIPSMSEPSNPNESLVAGTLEISEVITMAGKVCTFMDTNACGPNYMTSSLGTMHYYNGTYMYSCALAYYAANGTLPTSLSIETWFKLTGGTQGDATFGNDFSAYAAYLIPTANCQSTNATLISVAKTGMYYSSGAQGGYATPSTSYQAIFNLQEYINDKTNYDYYANTSRGALGTWNDKAGNCCDMGHLMVATSRALGVPARYEHWYCKFSSGYTGHVFAAHYLPDAPSNNISGEGYWIFTDPVNNENYLGYQSHTNVSEYSDSNCAELPF